jgi:hypothetical protein
MAPELPKENRGRPRGGGAGHVFRAIHHHPGEAAPPRLPRLRCHQNLTGAVLATK